MVQHIRERAGETQAGPAAVTVVIPAYNEELSIESVVRGVREVLPQATVLVVDDGSTDGTAEIAARAGASVISHPSNKGNGAAVKTALRAIQGGLVAVIDADGQHDPKELPKLIERLDTYDMAIGARPFTKGAGSVLRNIGNIALSKLASFLSERKVWDLTSGFRAFHHDKACRFLHVYPNGYSFPSTSALSFIGSGYDVDFTPVTVRPRAKGAKSKLRPFRDGFRFLQLVLRIITLSNPNKIFFPAGLLMTVIGIVITLRSLILFAQFSGGAVLFLAGGMNILFFGLVLDQFASLRLQERDNA